MARVPAGGRARCALLARAVGPAGGLVILGVAADATAGGGALTVAATGGAAATFVVLGTDAIEARRADRPFVRGFEVSVDIEFSTSLAVLRMSSSLVF